MPRLLLLKFDGVIYLVTAGRNAWRHIVQDAERQQRLIDDLARTVARSDWKLLSLSVLRSHIYPLLTTPRPKLARGMQAFLFVRSHLAGV